MTLIADCPHAVRHSANLFADDAAMLRETPEAATGRWISALEGSAQRKGRSLKRKRAVTRLSAGMDWSGAPEPGTRRRTSPRAQVEKVHGPKQTSMELGPGS